MFKHKRVRLVPIKVLEYSTNHLITWGIVARRRVGVTARDIRVTKNKKGIVSGFPPSIAISLITLKCYKILNIES